MIEALRSGQVHLTGLRLLAPHLTAENHRDVLARAAGKTKSEIEELNRLGREGSEAVAMVTSWGVGWRFVHPIVLLKRPRPADAEE